MFLDIPLFSPEIQRTLKLLKRSGTELQNHRPTKLVTTTRKNWTTRDRMNERKKEGVTEVWMNEMSAAGIGETETEILGILPGTTDGIPQEIPPGITQGITRGITGGITGKTITAEGNILIETEKKGPARAMMICTSLVSMVVEPTSQCQ